MSDWYIDRSRNISSVFKENMYSKLQDYITEFDLTDGYDTKKLVSFLGISGRNPNAYLTYLRDLGFLTEDNKPTNFLRICSLCDLSQEQITILLLVKRDSNKKTPSSVKPFVSIAKFLQLQKQLGNPMCINWNHCDKYLMDISSYDDLNEEKFNSLVFSTDFNQGRQVLDIWFNALLDSQLFVGNKKEITLSSKYEDLIEFIALHGEELPVNHTREEYMLHCSSAYHGLPQLMFNNSSDAIKYLGKYSWLFNFAASAEKVSEGRMIERIGTNTIFYGIPGCGKSYYIENKMLAGVDKENDVFRTTFYLDYSNSDFIGQIYPKVKNGNVTYENIPGPFTKALERALKNPEHMIYLVIEEINRGNAAAIFGDTFQLLDRLNVNKNGRFEGDSEYPITNEFIESYLGSLVQKGQVYIPRNLTILATMNTSDQNVFPLDTAFKRRWNMEIIVNDWKTCNIADLCIPFTDITWKNFANTINARMIQANEDGEVILNEDKKLGAYFATKEMLVKKDHRYDNTLENKAKLKKFITNVVDYLFNDVTKFDHTILFKEKITFDDIYKQVLNYELMDHEIDVFHNIFKEKVEPDVKDDE